MKVAILGYHQDSMSLAKLLFEIGAEPLIFTHHKSASKELIAGPIKRVQKCFLSKSELPIQGSRLVDLFRVVYEHHPLMDFEENPEFWKKFKEQNAQDKDLEYLKESSERFVDVDLVIDMLQDVDFPLPLGSAGTLALNEESARRGGHIFYGRDQLAAFKKICIDNSHQKYVIVGSQEDSLRAFLFLSKEIPLKNVSVICKEDALWEKIKDKELSLEYKSLLQKALAQFEQDKIKFEADIREWKEKEDFVKAKISKPTEPIFPLFLYPQMSVTAVDAFSNQNGLFLTLESAPFVNINPRPLTLSCHAVFVATGYQKDYSYLQSLKVQGRDLISSEPGYYQWTGPSDWPIIHKDLLKYFSPINVRDQQNV